MYQTQKVHIDKKTTKSKDRKKDINLKENEILVFVILVHPLRRSSARLKMDTSEEGGGNCATRRETPSAPFPRPLCNLWTGVKYLGVSATVGSVYTFYLNSAGASWHCTLCVGILDPRFEHLLYVQSGAEASSFQTLLFVFPVCK